MNKSGQGKFQFFQLVILLLVLGILAAYSSTRPDGLERIFQILELEKTSDADHSVPFADYVISPGFPDVLNQFLSALVEMVMNIGLGYLFIKFLIFDLNGIG